MKNNRVANSDLWTRDVILLTLTVFLARFGQGIHGGISTNFYVNDLGLGGDGVLWLAGIREIPGLTLVFLAALVMHLPQSQRAFFSLLLMGLGYGCYVFVRSFGSLVTMAVIASIGFHNWLPLQSSIAMGLVGKDLSGRVLGRMNSAGALASIGGMIVIVLFTKRFGLRPFFVVGGVLMVASAFVAFRLPRSIGADSATVQRIIFRKRYWLYYILTFFEGSRTQVFHAFGAWVLVDRYGLDARTISIVLILSGAANFLVAPFLGKWIDKFGERRSLTLSYLALALSFVGYATVNNAVGLSGLFIAIRLLVLTRIGLHSYINRIAPAEDLTPTLSAGVSINHITSVGMSLVAGTLLRIVGYQTLCWGAAGIILLSVPFAVAIRITAPAEPKDDSSHIK